MSRAIRQRRRFWLWRTGAALVLGIGSTLVAAWAPWFIVGPRADRLDRGLAVVDGMIVIVTVSMWTGAEEERWHVQRADEGELLREYAARIVAEGGESAERRSHDLFATITFSGLDPDGNRIDDIAAQGPPDGLLTQPVIEGGTTIVIARSGWPLRAVRSVTRLHFARGGGYKAPVWAFEGVLALPGGTAPNGWKREVKVPAGVMWGGMLVNCAVFGAGWLIVLLAPGVVRRSVRRKAGRCAGCGYDLGRLREAGCPECGWGREEAA